MTHHWRERFDEQFSQSWDERGADVVFGTQDEIKTFIDSLLDERTKEIVGMVDPTLKEVLNYLPDGQKYNDWVWDECTGEEQDAVKELRARTKAKMDDLRTKIEGVYNSK